MSPAATLRLQRWTAFAAVLWAVLALGLAIAGQVLARAEYMPPVQTSGTGGVVLVSWIARSAQQAGVEVGDRVVAVDGVPIREWFRDRGWERLEPGVPVVYAVESPDGVRREVALLPVPRAETRQALVLPVFLASLAVGVAYLALGVLVWQLRPDQEESFAFVLFCSALAMEFFSAVHTYDAWFGYERMLATLPFVGATTFHLFATFPVRPPWISRLPWLKHAAYLGAAVTAVLPLAGRGAPGAEHFGSAAYAYAILGASAGVAVLAREWARARGTPQGERMDVVFWGAVLSFVPVLALVSATLFFRLVLPAWMALVWFVVLPASVAYGIARNQLFEIRGLARSSAAYGAATLSITGLYAFLISFADAAFSRVRINASSPWFSVTFLFFAILAVNPLRNRLQGLVDRVFDRSRAGYREAVREISEAMVSMLSLDEVVDRLVTAVTESMGAERAMVLLEEAGALRPSAWRGPFEPRALELALAVDHPVGKQLWMRRQELSKADCEAGAEPGTAERCREVFEALDVDLLVPILFGVDLLGVIAVGRKLSSEPLGADDRQLLRTLANQSAIAIENAKAFDEIAKLNETLEARVEERTRELREIQSHLMQSEKMRSLGQLVAGVAHELNNPIGFVHANLQLLDGYVARLIAAQESGERAERVREAIQKLLLRSREGTQRVKAIVQDLRTFSRMDQAELGDADLNEEIERTLTLMEPRFKSGIRVERDFAELPRVRCLPGQLNQVFMNLLMNACDALDGRGGCIRIRTRPKAGGVELEFEDDGPGIPPEHRERIFEPFFTTKPVGKGTGLGLSISHGIVERHGGRMTLACPGDGGTCFRIELPRVARISEEEVAAATAESAARERGVVA